MSLFDVVEEKPKLNLKEIAKYLEDSPIVSVDLETTGFDLETDDITIVSVACEVNNEIKGWAIQVREFPIPIIKELLFKVFHDPKKIIVFHNRGFDEKFLNKNGIFITAIVADTIPMLWLNDEDRRRSMFGPKDNEEDKKSGGYGLKYNILKFFNYRMSSYQEARSLFGDFEQYAADDAIQTLRLFRLLEEKLKKLKLLDWMWQVEMPISGILVEMETRGVALDKKALKTLKAEAFVQIEKLEKKIYEAVGYKFDIGSPKQLSQVLFIDKKYGMRSDGTNEFSKRGKSGDWSTSDDILKAMKRAKIELAAVLLEFREINTKLNVFIKPLLERCVTAPYIIYPKFIQVGTTTGRFSSKDPNYQNLPRKGGIRKAFIARKGYKIVKADFSQAELRLMAHMSGDPIMIDIYRNNGDIHQTTAEACGVARQAAKAINFGLIYRMFAQRLVDQLATESGIIITKAQAQDYINKYFKKYKKVREYHQKVEKIALQRLAENGEFGWIKTIGGRYRRIDKMFLTMKETAFSAITQLINATIQGGVSDLIKVAMVDCQNIFKANGWLNPEQNIWEAYLQGQIHDEILAECKEELAEKVSEILKSCMENTGKKFGIKVPMLAEVKIVDHLGKED